MVPTRTRKPGKWEGIFQSGKSQGILNRLEKSEEIAQSTGNSGNCRQMLFIIFSNIEMNCVLFAEMDQVFSYKI